MNIAHESFVAGQTNAMLVPAQAGRIIRVVRLLVTCVAPVRLQLLSNPGPESQSILSPLHVGLAGLHLALGRRAALTARVGEAVGVTTAPEGGAGEHSVVLWYEVV